MYMLHTCTLHTYTFNTLHTYTRYTYIIHTYTFQTHTQYTYIYITHICIHITDTTPAELLHPSSGEGAIVSREQPISAIHPLPLLSVPTEPLSGLSYNSR